MTLDIDLAGSDIADSDIADSDIADDGRPASELAGPRTTRLGPSPLDSG